jgi:hypothetical protein
MLDDAILVTIGVVTLGLGYDPCDMSRTRRRAKLSKPGEHGGLVTLAGSAFLVALVAPQPVPALAAALVYVIAYLARGPVERKVRRFRLRDWDAPGLVVYALAALAAALLIARADPIMAVLVLGSALCFPGVGALVTRARVHRAFGVELIGLAACGGSAGVALYTGGAALATCVIVGLAMASYAASTVAMVRAEVRELEPPARLRLSRLGLAVLLAGGAAVAVAEPVLAIAFAPRLGHAAHRAVRGPGSHRIGVIAARETGELALFMVLLALGLLGVLG